MPSEIDGEKVRQFARTAAEAPSVSDEIAEDLVSEIEKGRFFYEQSSNATLIAAAEALVEDGKAEGKWASVVNGKKPATDLDIAIGEAFIYKLTKLYFCDRISLIHVKEREYDFFCSRNCCMERGIFCNN